MSKSICRPAALLAVLLGVTAGCQKGKPAAADRPEEPQAKAAPGFGVVHPQRKTVRRPIEQPGFNIEPFQETPLYARISGYVKKWHPDMGDRVKKGAVLAELDVPEMVVAVRQKDAAIRQAEAQVEQARAALASTRAQLARAKRQYERLTRVGKGGALDQESVDESRLGFEAATAGVEKARADVTAARAHVEVAKADRDHAQALLDYAVLRAHYDGVVTKRIVSEGDFVQPAGMGARGHPLYVVQQIDPVRVFVNVPGADALWLRDGDPVSFRLQGAGGERFTGKVTRNARALDPQARTLRTEIDVPNPKGKLLPGMYVQATILVTHPDVWTLPGSAIVTEGDQTFCYRLEGGKAVRTPLQVGLSGEGLVEVVKWQVKAGSSGEEGRWQDFTGREEVVSNPAGLSDGEVVRWAKGGK